MGLLLFIAIPAVELWLLIQVGGRIGVLETIAIIVLTGVIGWSLVKWQGLSTLHRIRRELASGSLPAREMVAGLCLVAAGLLLITPGFLTDVVGFLLLVPTFRRMLAGVLMKRFKHRIVTVGRRPGPPDGGNIIDV